MDIVPLAVNVKNKLELALSVNLPSKDKLELPNFNLFSPLEHGYSKEFSISP